VASWSGLLNRHEMSWDTELLELLGMDLDLFPPLSDADQPLEGMLPEFASRWPL
jgi:sugar (pentulose or hexulose) kinase